MKKKSLINQMFARRELGTVIPMIILCVVATLINANFLKIDNFVDIFRTTSYTFIVAIAVTYLMIPGELDLSIGAAMSLGSVMIAKCSVEWGFPIWIAFIFSILCGALVGVVNAFLVIKISLPAFIVTLGTQYALNGILAVITNNTPITGLPTSFRVLGQGRLFGLIPYTIIIAIILGIIAQLVLTYTKHGRKLICGGR